MTPYLYNNIHTFIYTNTHHSFNSGKRYLNNKTVKSNKIGKIFDPAKCNLNASGSIRINGHTIFTFYRFVFYLTHFILILEILIYSTSINKKN